MATVAIRGHNYIKSDTSEVVCFVLVKRKMECFNKNKNKVPNATVKIHDNTESGLCVCVCMCVSTVCSVQAGLEVIKAAGFVLRQIDFKSSSEEEKFLVATEQERIATNVKCWTDL